MQFSLSELVFAFIMGAGLVAWCLLLFALYSECSCHVDPSPSSTGLEHVMHLLIGFMAVWTSGIVLIILRNKID